MERSIGYQALIAILYFFSLYGLGALVSFKLREWEKFILGSVIAGIYLFILVHSNLLTKPLISLVYLGAIPGVFSLTRKVETEGQYRKERTIILLILLPLIFLALTPPHRFYDPQYYQLAIPQWYIIKKGFYWDPFFQSSLFAAFGNLLYIPLLAWGSDIGPQLLTLFSLFLTAIIFHIILVENVKENSLIPVIIFITIPFIYFISPIGQNGFLQTMFFTASLFYLFQIDSLNWKKILLLSLYLGAGGSTKYQGLVLWVFIMLSAFIFARSRGKVILVAFVSALLISPWYIRNYILTGNPMWPFLNTFFGLKPLSFDHDIVKATVSARKNILLVYLSRFFLWDFIKPERGLQSIAGPLILAFMPWSLFLLKETVIKKAWILYILFIPFGYILFGNPRYYIIFHLLLSYLAWKGFEVFQKNYRGATAILIVTMIFQVSIASAEIFKGAKFLFSRETISQFLQKNEPAYQLSTFTPWIPEDKPAIMVNYFKIFYLRRLTLDLKLKDKPESWENVKKISYKYHTRWVITPYPFIVTCTPFAPVKDTKNFTLWFRGVEHSSHAEGTSQ